jgi:hypothetical protein
MDFLEGAGGRLDGGGPVDRLTDAAICAATTDIPLHGNIDIGIGRFWGAADQGHGAHDLAGLAVTALRHLFIDPGLLYGFRQGIAGQSFDGCDFLSCHCGDRKAAGPDGITGKVNGTGAALGDAAAEFSAFEAYQVAYDPEQGHIGFGIYLDGFVVDGQAIRRHKIEKF